MAGGGTAERVQLGLRCSHLLSERIDDYADNEGLSKNQAIIALVELGFSLLDVEQARRSAHISTLKSTMHELPDIHTEETE